MTRELVQIRGMQAERVVFSTELDPFLSLKALAEYSGCGVRKLRAFLAAATHPLPHYRIGGKILVRRSEFDAWAAHYRQIGNQDLDRTVASVVAHLKAT